MHRWTDLLTSFGISTLLHGLLVLGAVWFWTLRTPELQPMFKGGDISLIVTLVAGPAKKTDVMRPKPVVAPDLAIKPLPEKEADQDMLDAPTAVPVSASVSTNAPVADSQSANQASKSADASSDALRQGVSSTVQMQSEIRPYYPLGARLRGEEGAVVIHVWVKPSGRASRCKVVRSSSYPALDKAALDAAQRARYVSTRPGTWRAEVETMLTFRFQLTE